MSTALLSFIRSISMPFVWWVVVAPWEQAVRVRFGKTPLRLGPGMHFKIPLVDRVYLVSVRTRIISDTGQTVMTRDRKPVSISVTVQFSVRDALLVFNAIYNPEATVLARIQAAVAATISSCEADDLTYDHIARSAQISIPNEWGLSGVEVRITNFAMVRTLRLMMHEYRSFSGLDESMSKHAEHTTA